MTFDPGMPMVPEVALFVLAVIVLVVGLIRQRDSGQIIGWLTLIGLLVTFGLTFMAREGQTLLDGSFVNDSLAIFAKKLFVSAAALSVLASLTLGQRVFERRAGEYHFVLIASVLGMLVLASARELILLFVAFELMSIPLYVLTGFVKREDAAPEAALKFFLVGTASSAIIVYGMSFIFGATGSTELAAIPGALQGNDPMMLLGMTLLLAGPRLQDCRVSVPHVGARHLRGGEHAICRLAGSSAEGGRLHRHHPPLRGRRRRRRARLDAGRGGGSWHDDHHRQPDGHSAAQHQTAAGLFGHRAHRLHADRPRGADRQRHRDGTVLSGRVSVWKHGRLLRGRGGGALGELEEIDAYKGLAQRSPLLALAMLVFLLSLGGIPFVAGFWAKLYVFLAAVDRGMYGLVFLGAVLTVVALYYYLLVARRMYIEEPVRTGRIKVSPLLGLAILICIVGVVGIGAWPGPWVTATQRAAASVFAAPAASAK
jgi:NADH-quinone oxidoreductase subunit N